MLERTTKILRQGIEQGLHLGAQLYISQNGEPIANLAIGEARPGVAMSPDSINLWWSSVKPVIAVAIAQLQERGKLNFDDRVAVTIPEFAARGKEAITIRHILTHTGGFRAWPNVELSAPWDEIVASICQVPLEPGWVPGERAGYHPRTGWFILGEIIRRIDGRACDRYVREEIFLPLSMRDSWLSIPSDVYRTYSAADRLSVMQDVSTKPADRGDSGAGFPSESDAAISHPGGSGRGPIRELGRFYEMLLNGGILGDARILSPQTVETITAPQRIGMFDQTFKHVIDYGLGFIVNSAKYGAETAPYNYGRYASPKTFGHSGAQSSCGFCDPEHGLVVTWVCNGMPGEARHQQRQRAINNAIYEDLFPADSTT